MKITFIISHMTVFVGGSKFLMDYANALSKKNHNITIISQKFDKNNFNFNKEIKLIEIGGPLPSSPFFWLKFKKVKKMYIEEINKVRADLTVAVDFPSNYFCSSIKKKQNFNYIFYCLEPYRYFHDKNFYRNAPFYLRIISLVLRLFFKKYDLEGTIKADRIITISKFTSERIKKFYGKRSHYIHYIGVKINNDLNKINKIYEKKKIIIERENPIIFSLGYSHHLKGAKELIIIFSKILSKVPNASLIIGGWIHKNCYKVMYKYIRKLKIPMNKIHFYGFIENNELDSIYQKSTITFYTAIDESYGLIPLESMKNGTPVIAFEGGPSETIIDGKNGFIIKNHNLDEFANKAIELINNKLLYLELSKKSIKHIIQNFNFQRSVLDLELIFQKAID